MNIKNLYLWHKRLGLTLGFIVFLMALSGAIINYRDELLPIVYGDLIRVSPTEKRADLIVLYDAAKAYLQDKEITHLYTSVEDSSASMIFFRPTGAFLPHLLTIDPYSGKVLGTMPLVKNIFGVMLYLHSNLFLGKVGAWVVGLMGLLVVFFFISGLIIWWPKTSLFKKIKALPRSGIRGLHRGLGIFFGIPIVFSAVTGFILSFNLPLVLGQVMGDAPRPEEMVVKEQCQEEDQRKVLLGLAREQIEKLVSVHFCNPKNGLMKVSYGLKGRSGNKGYVRLVINPLTQTVVQKFDTSTDPKSWSANALLIYPLHTGAEFGAFGRMSSFLSGIALGMLFITGLLSKYLRRIKNFLKLH